MPAQRRTPIERFILWMHRPQKCKQCRINLAVENGACSLECADEWMRDMAY